MFVFSRQIDVPLLQRSCDVLPETPAFKHHNVILYLEKWFNTVSTSMARYLQNQVSISKIMIHMSWNTPGDVINMIYCQNIVKVLNSVLKNLFLTWIQSGPVSPQDVSASWWRAVLRCQSLWSLRCCRWTPASRSTRPELYTRWSRWSSASPRRWPLNTHTHFTHIEWNQCKSSRG